MKNKIEDLRNHLFAQLEILGDEEKMKNPIALEREVKKAKAIKEIAEVLVNSAKVEVDYIRATENKGTGFLPEDNQKKIG
jgi:BioD-like phosphotransacetylase family protein